MTDTEIANLALTKIGANQITDLTTSSAKEAVVSRQFYKTNFESVCRMHKWRCLIKRASLAKLSTTPEFGWDNEFALPSDYLQIIEAEDYYDEYTIEGNKLLSNDDTVKIRYIHLPTDLSVLDSWCLKAIYVSLAAEISYSITQDADLRASLIRELEDVILPQARYYSAIEQNEPEPNHTSSWLSSRRNFYVGEW